MWPDVDPKSSSCTAGRADGLFGLAFGREDEGIRMGTTSVENVSAVTISASMIGSSGSVLVSGTVIVLPTAGVGCGFSVTVPCDVFLLCRRQIKYPRTRPPSMVNGSTTAITSAVVRLVLLVSVGKARRHVFSRGERELPRSMFCVESDKIISVQSHAQAHRG